MPDAWKLSEKAQALIDSKQEAKVESGWKMLERALVLAEHDPYENHVQQPIVLNALESDFERGFQLARRSYREKNTGFRLEYYRELLKHFRARAVPLVVDGLCLPWDSSAEYDFITHSKYVTRILKLLAKYELQPHLPQIQAAFAKVKDRKVHDALAAGLGKLAPARKAPAKKFELPKKRLGVDRYAQGVIKAIRAERKALPKRLKSIALYPGPLEVQAIFVNDEVEIEIAAPDFPRANPFPSYFKRHGFDPDDDELPQYNSSNKLPECAVYLELFSKLSKLAPRARVAIGGLGPRDEPFTRHLKEGIAFAANAGDGGVALRELAAILYESPAKRSWLVGLVG